MKLLVKEVAEAKGYRNAKDLADRMGMSYSTIYPIWDGTTKRIDLSTLERLCRFLRVQPGMLIIWLDEGELTGETAPVPAIRPPQKKRGPKSQAKTAGRSQATAVVAGV